MTLHELQLPQDGGVEVPCSGVGVWAHRCGKELARRCFYNKSGLGHIMQHPGQRSASLRAFRRATKYIPVGFGWPGHLLLDAIDGLALLSNLLLQGIHPWNAIASLSRLCHQLRHLRNPFKDHRQIPLKVVHVLPQPLYIHRCIYRTTRASLCLSPFGQCGWTTRL